MSWTYETEKTRPIHELPGFHGSCILEPNVRTLASLLLSYLRPFEENRQG